MRNRVLAWGPALLWAGILLFFGSRASEDLPGGGVLEGLPGADKAVHAAAYALLGALVQRASPRAAPWAAAAAGAAAGLAVGGMDELLQTRAAGRTPDPLDLLADVAGAALGAWLRLRTFDRHARSR